MLIISTPLPQKLIDIYLKDDSRKVRGSDGWQKNKKTRRQDNMSTGLKEDREEESINLVSLYSLKGRNKNEEYYGVCCRKSGE